MRRTPCGYTVSIYADGREFNLTKEGLFMKIETYFNANTHLSNFSSKGGGIVKWCTLYCPLVLSEQQ